MRARSRIEFESHWSQEFGGIVAGTFTPVLAKHTKSFNLIDTLSVGVDRIQELRAATAPGRIVEEDAGYR